jgi:aspartokinase/homoserine dehydrogenase 1
MLVLKFGGTSVGSAGALEKLVAILKDQEHENRVRLVVVSALSGITDGLIAMARKTALGGSFAGDLAGMQQRHGELCVALLEGETRQAAEASLGALFLELTRILEGTAITRELSARTLDHIMSFGERLSANLIACLLTGRGIPAEYLDSRFFILTDDNYGAARFFPAETYSIIRSGLGKRPQLQVAAGFIAADSHGRTTTLGRGGSDLSAAIFGAALDVEAVEIWSDVDGILTADPRKVPGAFRIDAITYEEAMELAHFGAKVLHPPTVKPAWEKGIPIIIKNTFNPASPGTLIDAGAPSPWPIRGVTSISSVTLVRLQGSGMVGVAGFSSRLFGALARQKINVILISQSSSEYSICFAVDPKDSSFAAGALAEEFAAEIRRASIEAPVVEGGLAILAVVGNRMRHMAEVSCKFFQALGRIGVNVAAIAQGSSEINISAVISQRDEVKALNAVHETFFRASLRPLNLFLLGAGLIGGALLAQLADHRDLLAQRAQVRINLAGAANSRRMLFNAEGLDPQTVQERLRKHKAGEGGVESFDLDRFIQRIQDLNLPNTCFCDCSPGDQVAARYAGLLEAAIPIVTPNKKANSGSLEYYRRLISCSRERGIPYLYETTVCAGLPVLSTIRDLALTGDKVRRIEAVLSGTLSFIFNNFDGSASFSRLLREARAAGYTEPDPRDDLNAMDAARKALILARECDMPLEFEAVDIEAILPPACFEAPNVEAFFIELEKLDGAFEQRWAGAAKQGKVLRYVALIEDGAVRLALREEAEGSPFRSLSGEDNMVVITTDRYAELPIVIKGPGAGAQVTAGGVLADILRVARTLI